MKQRNGKMTAAGGAGLALLIVLAVAAVVMIGKDYLPTQASLDNTPQNTATGTQCFGIASVALSYNDIDEFTPGTDPGVDNLYIFTDNIGAQAEGAITLSPGMSFSGLAAENSTTVFSEPVNFQTGCTNAAYPVNVVKAGAPTITAKNSNGVTINADATDEAVSADQTYDGTLTIKAPSKQSSSRHGAVLVAQYDKTFISSVEVSGLQQSQAPNYLTFGSIENGTADGQTAWIFSGELENGAQTEISFSFETTGTTPNEGNANILWHWLPLNYDVDDRSNSLHGPSAENARGNAKIALGDTTFQFFTS